MELNRFTLMSGDIGATCTNAIAPEYAPAPVTTESINRLIADFDLIQNRKPLEIHGREGLSERVVEMLCKAGFVFRGTGTFQDMPVKFVRWDFAPLNMGFMRDAKGGMVVLDCRTDEEKEADARPIPMP